MHYYFIDTNRFYFQFLLYLFNLFLIKKENNKIVLFFIYDSFLRYFTNLQVRPLSSATRPLTASSSEIVAKLNSPLPLPQIWKFSPT